MTMQQKVSDYLSTIYEQGEKVRIKVEHPGMLEVPEGKNVEDMSDTHFQKLITKKGWNEISKAIINLKVWNKTRDPKLSSWADKTQERLAKWVEKKREKDPTFGD